MTVRYGTYPVRVSFPSLAGGLGFLQLPRLVMVTFFGPKEQQDPFPFRSIYLSILSMQSQWRRHRALLVVDGVELPDAGWSLSTRVEDHRDDDKGSIQHARSCTSKGASTKGQVGEECE